MVAGGGARDRARGLEDRAAAAADAAGAVQPAQLRAGVHGGPVLGLHMGVQRRRSPRHGVHT